MMTHARPGLWKTAVALAFASAGIAKLASVDAERKLFRSWGWSEDDMHIIGAAELGGAAMLVTPSLSFIGGLLLAATSTCIASAELRHRNDKLVTPRLALLGASVSTLLARG